MAFEGNLKTIPGVVASADLSASQFLFMNISSTGAALNTTAGAMVDGVLQNKPDALNKPATVAYSGVSKVIAGAAVAKGARVMSNTAGKAITGTATNIGVGRALEAASADGDAIAVLLDTKGDTLA
jgi:hypothetical protein